MELELSTLPFWAKATAYAGGAGGRADGRADERAGGRTGGRAETNILPNPNPLKGKARYEEAYVPKP